MFQSILAATDRVTGRDPVVITAARLARALDSTWSIIHCLESASLRNRKRVLHFQTGESIEATKAYHTKVRRHLHLAYRDLFKWVPPGDIDITTGFPWEEIERQARRHRVDLIIMGPHAGIRDKSGALRVLGRIGSTVEGVIIRAAAPVMIINKHPCRPKPSFYRLLVGIDFSTSCRHALAFAADLARFFSAQIHLFHMLPVSPYPKYAWDQYRSDLKKTRNRLSSFCHDHLIDHLHFYHLWGGALPYRELFKCAERVQADAIILGSHTKEVQGKWYAGSTVEKISFQATCPVFVLSEPHAQIASRQTGAETVSSIGSRDTIPPVSEDMR